MTTALGMDCMFLPRHPRERDSEGAQWDENVRFHSLVQGIQGTGMGGN